jgi:hypothetical protein
MHPNQYYYLILKNLKIKSDDYIICLLKVLKVFLRRICIKVFQYFLPCFKHSINKYILYRYLFFKCLQ